MSSNFQQLYTITSPLPLKTQSDFDNAMVAALSVEVTGVSNPFDDKAGGA